MKTLFTIILCASVACISNAQNFHLTSMDDISVRSSYGPEQAIIADFNNDGIPDLLVSAVIYLGLGNGKFSSGNMAPTRSAQGMSAVGDFNGDGNKDVAMLGTYRLIIFYGDGQGNLSTPVIFELPTIPSSIQALDINHNSEDDLVIGFKGTAMINTYIDNDFTSYITIALGGHPSCITAADFNSDGNADIAVGFSNEPSVEVMKGNGHGGFKKSAVLACSQYPTSLDTADFDKNGLPDIIAGCNNSVMVAMDTAKGSFSVTSYSTSDLDDTHQANAWYVRTGDFNHDGYVDFAMYGSLGEGVYFCYNSDKGQSFENAYQVIIGGNVREVKEGLHGNFAVGDFNLDGFDDVALPSFRSDECIILMNDQKNFQSYDYGRFTRDANNLAIGDFNEDGFGDLAIYSTDEAIIYNGSASGISKSESNTVSFNSGGGEIAEIGLAIADLNNDGHLDLIAGGDPDREENNLIVRLGNGDGTFQNHEIASSTGGVNPARFFTGDFNNDGNPDLILCGASFDGVSDVCVLLGKGNGSFKNPVLVNTGVQVVDIAPADFNKDHYLDFVVAYTAIFYGGPYGVLEFINDGKGNFSQGLKISLSRSPSSIAAGDFDNDHNPDIMVNGSSGTGFTLSLFRGLGEGTFEQEEEIPEVSEFFQSFIASDMNNDGHLDLIATADSVGEGIGVLLGNGDGSFTEYQYSANSSPFGVVAVGDMNGDGQLDAATVTNDGWDGDAAFLMYNTSTNAPSTCKNGCDDFKIVSEKKSATPMISPNPFHASASLQLPSDHTFQLLISDAAGRIVEAKNNINGAFQFGESLLPGIYFVKIFSNDQQLPIIKIVKN